MFLQTNPFTVGCSPAEENPFKPEWNLIILENLPQWFMLLSFSCRFTEDGCPHKKFFHTRYLMRMRLTPDCSKMLISTSSGYLLILHDLDLTQSLEVGSYRMLRARRTPLSSGKKKQNIFNVIISLSHSVFCVFPFFVFSFLDFSVCYFLSVKFIWI